MTLIPALTPITITAPAGVDGRGEIAVLNNSADGNFVGWLYKFSGFGGAPVRQSLDDVVEGPGAVFGTFFDSPRSWTQTIILAPAATYALSDARYDKLCRAMYAMGADGTVSWTDASGAAKQMAFRRDQPPTDPDSDRQVLISGINKDPRIYSGGSEITATAATSLTLTNSGNVGTLPRFTVASPSAAITFTNSTTGQSLAFSGLDGSGTLTVDFLNKTASRGGVNKYDKIVFPTTWWELAPGANSITVTNAAQPFFRHAYLSG